MKKINRAILRGKPLDKECYKAQRTTHEYGKDDNRVFCYGLIDKMSGEVLPQCINCYANIFVLSDDERFAVKVKDDIDLAILVDKYGFRFCGGRYVYPDRWGLDIAISVIPHTRVIETSAFNDVLNILWKDNIVEKIYITSHKQYLELHELPCWAWNEEESDKE